MDIEMEKIVSSSSCSSEKEDEWIVVKSRVMRREGENDKGNTTYLAKDDDSAAYESVRNLFTVNGTFEKEDAHGFSVEPSAPTEEADAFKRKQLGGEEQENYCISKMMNLGL